MTTPQATQSDPCAHIAKRYEQFAKYEASGESRTYTDWARAVAGDERVLAFLSTLTPDKQQPNLLFGATRFLFGTPDDPAEFLALVAEHEGDIRTVMEARRVQTNEPARCATLLPALASLPQPLALIEVGASAGLCLLPDHYAYVYGRRELAPTVGDATEAPTFRCAANAATPLDFDMPQIAWRMGLDLHPIDSSDPDQARWLQTLVWPEHTGRSEGLRRALQIAHEHPPTVLAGDLTSDLDTILARVPSNATPVLFHSAVLNYLPSRAAIDDFAAQVTAADVHWLSNESPQVLPQHAASLAEPIPKNRFLLALDGVPLAATGPHGQSIDWIETPIS